jgi:hypothetical protein
MTNLETASPSILEEALKVSGENRQRDYGHPLENHERIAAIWNVVLGPKLKEPITPEEVVWCMIGLKMAREVNSKKVDNMVDVAGYINCLDLIAQKRRDQMLESLFGCSDKLCVCDCSVPCRSNCGTWCVKCSRPFKV